MRFASSLYHEASLVVAVSVLAGVSEAFSVPYSHLSAAATFGSIRKGPQRPLPLFYSEHMFVHEDGAHALRSEALWPKERKGYA